MKLDYDQTYRHYSQLVDTSQEVSQKAKEQRQKAAQARMAHENNNLLTTWRK